MRTYHLPAVAHVQVSCTAEAPFVKYVRWLLYCQAPLTHW